MDYRFRALTNVEKPIRPLHIKEKFSKLALSSTKKVEVNSPKTPEKENQAKCPIMDTTRRTLFTDNDSEEESAQPVSASKNKILLTPKTSESSRPSGSMSQNIRLQYSDPDETVCSSVEKMTRKSICNSRPPMPVASESLFSESTYRPNRRKEHSDSVSNLSICMSGMGLEEVAAKAPVPNTQMEPLIYEDDQDVTVISDTSSEEASSKSEATPDKPKKEKVIVISDSEEEEPEVEVDDVEFYSKVVSRISETSQMTVTSKLNNFFDNIPSARSSERFSFLNRPKDEHVEKQDMSNEKDNVIMEENEEIPDSSDEQAGDDMPQEHVEIAESADEDDAVAPVVQEKQKSKASLSTEANTDLVPVKDVKIDTPNSLKQTSFSGKINISTKIQINIQFSHHSSDSSESETTSGSDDDDVDEVSPVRKKIQVSSHRKVNISSDKTRNTGGKWRMKSRTTKSAKQTPEATNAKKMPNPSTTKRTPKTKNNSLRAEKTTPKLEKVVEQQGNVEIPKGDVITEAMEAILNEVYGTEWQTPALLQQCESRKKTVSHPDFSLFDKRIACNLESTRLTALDATTDNGAKPKATTSPFFKSPPAPRANSKPTTPKSAVAVFDQTRARRQAQQLTQRKQALMTVCDSDSGSEEDQDMDSSSEASWKSNCSEASSDSEESPVVTAPKTKGRAKPRKMQRNISDKENASAESDDELNGTLSRKFLNILDSCEFRQKPRIPATPDPVKEISDLIKSIGVNAPNTDATTTTTKRKLFTKRYSVEAGERRSETENETDENQLDGSLIKDDVVLKMPIPDYLFKPTNKKLEKVKNIDVGATTPKPKAKTTKAKPLQSTPDKVKTKNIVPEPTTPTTKKYGFLQSLDVTISKHLCHPEAVVYRDNYKTKKEELATILYDLYNDKVFDGKLVATITWNKKLLNTAGRCNNSRRAGERSSRIELSDKVLTSADRLRCTLIHEMAHAATWIFSAENGHGSTWKAWTHKANQVFPELPKIGVRHSYEIEYKYTYECVACKAKYNAHSRSKKVEQIRCSYCHGSIKLFLNKKDKTGNVVVTPARTATGFAKFVKEKYKAFKRPDLKHADVMKLLSGEFASLAMEEKIKY